MGLTASSFGCPALVNQAGLAFPYGGKKDYFSLQKG